MTYFDIVRGIGRRYRAQQAFPELVLSEKSVLECIHVESLLRAIVVELRVTEQSRRGPHYLSWGRLLKLCRLDHVPLRSLLNHLLTSCQSKTRLVSLSIALHSDMVRGNSHGKEEVLLPVISLTTATTRTASPAAFTAVHVYSPSSSEVIERISK